MQLALLFYVQIEVSCLWNEAVIVLPMGKSDYLSSIKAEKLHFHVPLSKTRCLATMIDGGKVCNFSSF